MNGKSIRIFLPDGVPTGLLLAEIPNWTGKVLVAPRNRLPDLLARPEVRRPGVYLLVGPDPDQPSRDKVYIGEGDDVRKRLASHEKDESKDYWTRTVAISSKDENLTKAHVRYLESRLIEIAKVAGRAALANGTAPDPNALPEADVADMEFFLAQVQLVLPILGFNFTRPKTTVAIEITGPAPSPASPEFVMKKVGAVARARESDGEFVVLKGSTARKGARASWTSYRGLREQLVEDGKLVDAAQDGLYVFTEDVPFASPSAAAAVVNAGNQNGRIAWKVGDTNTTYAEWQEQKVKAVTGE